MRHLDESDRGASVLSLARGDVPERVREVVNLRLVRLSDACLRLLTVAAVMGTDFEPALLEQVSDLQGEDLAIALDEALAADVLVEAESGEHELFSFSHALVRRTLLARVTRAHKRRIHARVAEVLESSRGEWRCWRSPTTCARPARCPIARRRWTTPRGRRSRPRPGWRTRRPWTCSRARGCSCRPTTRAAAGSP